MSYVPPPPTLTFSLDSEFSTQPPLYDFPLLCLTANAFGHFRYHRPPLPIQLYLSEKAAPMELPEQVSGCLRQH